MQENALTNLSFVKESWEEKQPGCEVDLTHIQLLPKLRTCRITPLLPVHACMASQGLYLCHFPNLYLIKQLSIPCQAGTEGMERYSSTHTQPCSKRGWVVNDTPWPLYPLEGDPIDLVQKAGRAWGLVWKVILLNTRKTGFICVVWMSFTSLFIHEYSFCTKIHFWESWQTRISIHHVDYLRLLSLL